jgi:predicted CoA-binding protein
VLWLRNAGFKVIAIGSKTGKIGDVDILQTLPTTINKLYAITLYLNPENQSNYYTTILNLNPKQVIFNPLTENHELAFLLNKNNIKYIEACTLVMLKTGQF